MVLKASRNRFLTGCSATVAALAFAQAVPAYAQAQTYEIDIEAQDLGSALREFARETRQQVTFDDAAVRGKRAPAVRGSFTARAVLDRILANSGLSVRQGSSGIFIIERAGRDVAQAGQEETDASETAVTPSSLIIVSGTRLADEFTGVTPTQVIGQEEAARSGLLDSARVLRTQPQVSGPKSTLQYNGSLSAGGQSDDGGVGTQTIALRGFLPSQTLVLVDGRRVVNAGVEGIPRAPDISLIPFSVVQEYQIVTDGASPVYGTDAIAGVINVQLRKDIDETTLYGTVSIPSRSGDPEYILSGVTGKSFDRGFVTVAAEYRNSPGLKYRDVDYFGLDCNAFYDRDSNGRVRENDVRSAQLPGTSLTPCLSNSLDQRTGSFSTTTGFRSYFYTPGTSNIGVTNFSTGAVPIQATRFDRARIFGQDGLPTGMLSAPLALVPFDQDGDGALNFEQVFDENFNVVQEADSAFFDPDGDGTVGFDLKNEDYVFTRGASADQADFIAPLEQFSLFTYGEYDFDGLGTAYFEASYNRRESDTQTVGQNINVFAGNYFVPVDNPFNPCGLEQSLCYDYVEQGPGENPNVLVNQAVVPFVKIRGDGDRVRTSIDQYRAIVGLRGDAGLLNGIGDGDLFRNWKFDVSALYNRSEGQSQRRGILQDRLELSLSTTVRDPNSGQIVCGADEDFDGLPDDASSCVPVNLFTEAAMLRGQLTAEEEQYLFADLDYNTQVELFVANAFLSGDAIRLPAGYMNWVIGGEFRVDSIDSLGNENARNQNFATFSRFVDPGAKGSREIFEAFGEVGIPVLDDSPLGKSLVVNLAGRVTDEEFTGTNGTYSVGGRYEPTDWLALRGTYGRSFRAPNAFELFRLPFSTEDTFIRFIDPCIVPFQATTPDGSYDPANDPRSNVILDQCSSDGLDPTSLGLGQFFFPTTDVASGGATDDLKPETSESLTAGFVFSLDKANTGPTSIFQRTSLQLSATYYEIKLENQIELGSVFSIINGCYTEVTERLYCARIERNSDGFITDLTTGSVNSSRRETSGIDFNARLGRDFNVSNRPFTATLQLAGNYEFDVTTGSDANDLDLSGSYLYPKLKGNATFAIESGEWIGTWFTSYVGSGGPVQENSFQPGRTPTCLVGEGVTCDPILNVDDYFLHNLTVAWRTPSLTIAAGINNVFDVEPPRISPSSVINDRSNTLLNGNYDPFGRTFTLQVRKTF